MDLNDIDKLLANMLREKPESEQPVQDTIMNDADDDSILNEMVNGNNVSDLGSYNNVALAATTNPPSVTECDQFIFDYSGQPQISNVDNQQKTNNDTPLTIPVVTMTYELSGQQMVILPLNPNQTYTCKNADAFITPLSATKKIGTYVEIITPKLQASGSRKRKLYEEEEFSNPEEEMKRKRAINAKNHRDKNKKSIQELQKKLDTTAVERNALARDVEKLSNQVEIQQKEAQEKEKECKAHIDEIEKLRQLNEELKKKYKILLGLTSN